VFFPVWSPDGRRIAYVGAPDYPDRWVGSLWSMRASDGEGKRLVARQIEPTGSAGSHGPVGNAQAEAR